MSLKAHVNGDGELMFALQTSVGGEVNFGATLIGPAEVERATGTFRNPEALVGLAKDVVRVLSEGDDSDARGSVLGLIVHTASGHAAAVGIFPSAAACRSWWHQPFNRLLRDPDVLLVLAAVSAD